jgi:hypothetical protein
LIYLIKYFKGRYLYLYLPTAVLVFAKTTLPAVADIEMVPEASGVGKLALPPEPAFSCTRKYYKKH